MANGVEVARAFVTIIPTTQGAQAAITNAIAPAAASAGSKAGLLAGAPMLAGITGALSKFVAPAAIIGGLTLIGKKGVEAFQEVEAGANNVIKATGATGKQAEELVGAYKNVSKHVVGDFGDIGSAVGELNTRLGLTGTDLEGASEAMMKYAKVTGQDATAATKDVASMMRNTGIPTGELADTLGKLTVAGQAAGIDVSKLAQNTTKYNAVMKQLGLSTDEQIALMAKFEQSGADTQSILNAMKKGVANWAKEGKDAKVEFANFTKGVQDGSVTAGDAVEIFGAKGGLSMYEAAQKGQLSFEEMYEAITNASAENLNTVYQDTLTASEKIDLAWQNITLAAGEMFEPVMEGFATLLDNFVVPTAQGIADVFTEANGIADVFVGLADLAMSAIGDMVVGILEGLPAAIDGFADMVNGFIDQLANGKNPLQKSGEGLFAKIGDALKRSWPKIKTALGNALKSIGRSLLDNGPTILKNAASMLGKMALGFAKALPGLLSSLGSLLLMLVQKIPTVGGQILSKGAELIGKLVSGLAKEGPKVASKIGEIVGKIPGKIAEFFARILTKGGELVGKIVSGIQGKASQVPTKIGEMIQKALGKIGEFFGGFLNKGGELVGNLISGITGKKEAAANAMGNVTKGANSAASGFADTFKSTGEKLTGKYAGGLWGNRAKATDNAYSIGEKTVNNMNWSGTADKYGSGMAGQFGKGIWGNRSGAIDNAYSVGEKSVNNLNWYNTSYNTGKNFADGFALGIKANAWKASTQARNMGNAAVGALKSAVNSASPSKAAAEVGGWFSEGFAIGIEEDERLAIQAAQHMGQATTSALNGTATSGYTFDTAGRELVAVNVTGNNFNVSNEMDARRAAEIIGTEVQRQLRGRL